MTPGAVEMGMLSTQVGCSSCGKYTYIHVHIYVVMYIHIYIHNIHICISKSIRNGDEGLSQSFIDWLKI